MNTSFLRTLALAAAAGTAAFGAAADEPDGFSDRALQMQSSRTVAEVRAEAREPWRITNGGTGVHGGGGMAATRPAMAAPPMAAGAMSAMSGMSGTPGATAMMGAGPDTSREAVRQQAREAVRTGQTSRGEMGMPRNAWR